VVEFVVAFFVVLEPGPELFWCHGGLLLLVKREA